MGRAEHKFPSFINAEAGRWQYPPNCTARERPYSAAAGAYRALGVRMVTSSSVAVRCSAMVASKSGLAAFIFNVEHLHHFGHTVTGDMTAD
jgi:hypothetical protein